MVTRSNLIEHHAVVPERRVVDSRRQRYDQRKRLPRQRGTLHLALPPALAQEAAGEPEVEMLWALKVPMRDGVSLNATVFKPKGQPGRWPVVVRCGESGTLKLWLRVLPAQGR